jgi:CubicO group peptidase (beta-lactamase class C family)
MQFIHKSLWVAMIALFLPVVTIAEVRDVSDRVEAIRKKHDLPGIVAVVVEGDQIVLSGTAGVRKAGSAEKITLLDKVHIGSCAKAITATLVAMLVQDGTLRWDMTLAEALPEIAPSMNEKCRSITLNQLVTNTSGIKDHLIGTEIWPKLVQANDKPTESRRMLAQWTLSRPPEADPGTRFIYSNCGFAIAGHIVEVRTGVPFETLVQERLFKPLGITSAGFGAPGTPGAVDQPRGHSIQGHPIEPSRVADNPSAIAPAGTMHMSIIDWAKFISLHIRPADAEQKLISSETLALLHKPAGLEGADYAMGWIVTTRPWAKAGPDTPGVALTHSGSNTRWFSVVWMAPERNFAILAVTNSGVRAAPQALDDLAGELIRAYLAMKN